MRTDPRSGALAALLAGALALAASARADDEGAGAGADADQAILPLAKLRERARALFDQASQELIPPLVPPQAHAVDWQARRVSSVDLDAPLLALGAADLDGDGTAEILALTTEQLILVERSGHRQLQARTRALLPGPAASVRPRDPVGTMVVMDRDGDGRAEVWVRSSERAQGALFRYQDSALVAAEMAAGFPLCDDVRAELDPGRNYFDRVLLGPPSPDPGVDPARGAPPIAPESARGRAFQGERPERFFAGRCGDGLVDTAGRPLDVAGVIGNDGTLFLWSERTCRTDDAECLAAPMAQRKLADNGALFEIADMDNDGQPEVVVTAPVPPGESDRVSVYSWRGERLHNLYQRSFSGGVVGLAAGDIDGDKQLELLAAVRLFGSHRVDLWIFNR